MPDDRRPQREGSGEGGGERRFFAKPKFCPRRQTGACARHQRVVAAAIKQSRQVALLPFVGKSFEEGR